MAGCADHRAVLRRPGRLGGDLAPLNGGGRRQRRGQGRGQPQERAAPRRRHRAGHSRARKATVVEAGEVLIVARRHPGAAEFEVLREQYCRAARHRGPPAGRVGRRGRHRSCRPNWPAAGDDRYARNIWAGQVKQFESRRAAIEGQRKRDRREDPPARVPDRRRRGPGQGLRRADRLGAQRGGQAWRRWSRRSCCRGRACCSSSAPRRAGRPDRRCRRPISPSAARPSPSRNCRSPSSATTAWPT